MSNLVTSTIESRIADQKEAIEKLARLHRDLVDVRASLTLPEAVQRVDSLLSLNAEYLHALRHELCDSLARVRSRREAAELVPAGF